MVTRTINQLHFEDLDPIRFEELILSIVYRMKKWHILNHFGKRGSDAGIDIRAVEMLENGEEYTYYFQCKRYEKMQKSTIKKIIDDYLINNIIIPNKYILVVSCSLTKSQIEYFEQYCKENKFNCVNVWTSTFIESMLYFQYPDLLYIYFGVNMISDDCKNKFKRFDYLKLYLDNLNDNMKKFKYNGELTQTFFCLRDIFNLQLDKFKYIKELHKNNDYLFEMESNLCIYSMIEEIDIMISRYVNTFRNVDVDRQLEITEWMDNIGVKIYKFENEYIEIIKTQMSDILLGS